MFSSLFLTTRAPTLPIYSPTLPQTNQILISLHCGGERVACPARPCAARAVLCLAALAVAIGCLTSPGCETSKPRGTLETFDDVYRYREAMRDSLIALTGRFMGWQGGECVFPSYAAPQATRSDWIFKIGDSCLYVTGGRPPDVSPMEGTGVGRQIRLDARLRITPDSRVLLEYVSSAPVVQ